MRSKVRLAIFSQLYPLSFEKALIDTAILESYSAQLRGQYARNNTDLCRRDVM